jgi:hypothetical protein
VLTPAWSPARSWRPCPDSSSLVTRRCARRLHQANAGFTRSSSTATGRTCKTAKLPIYTRRGYNWTRRFQPIADALAALPIKDVILDGEAVVARGIRDFELLHADLVAGRKDRLLYAGKVRGGFTEADARDLRERLDQFIRKDSPLTEPVNKPKATCVEHRARHGASLRQADRAAPRRDYTGAVHDRLSARKARRAHLHRLPAERPRHDGHRHLVASGA